MINACANINMTIVLLGNYGRKSAIAIGDFQVQGNSNVLWKGIRYFYDLEVTYKLNTLNVG